MPRVFHLICLVLALTNSIVQATTSSYTKEYCYTKQTTKKPASVVTTTSVKVTTHTVFVKTITTPTKFVTTSPATTVDTVYSTVFTTSTTTTTSVLDPTTTVQPSPNFTPIKAELEASGHIVTKKKRSIDQNVDHAVKAKQEIELRRPHSRLERRNGPPCRCSVGPDGNSECSPTQYPATVSCKEFIAVIATKTVIYTAKSTVTVDVPQPTITGVTTVTTTSTVVSTSTYFTPQETYYAACGLDNQVTTVDGMGIPTAESIYFANRFDTTAPSPYDCCVLCLLSPTCGVSFWTAGTNECQSYDNTGVCNGANQVADFVAIADFTPPGFTIMNSNCGQWRYDGQTFS